MNVAPKNRLTHLLFAVGVLAGVVIGTTQPMRADLFSVAFKTNSPYGNSPLISGPEPAATAPPIYGTICMARTRLAPTQAGAIWSIAAAQRQVSAFPSPEP